MKSNSFCCFLRSSLFDILPFAFDDLRPSCQYRNPTLFKSRKSHAQFLLIFACAGTKRKYFKDLADEQIQEDKKDRRGFGSDS